jgi:hypothetical protein
MRTTATIVCLVVALLGAGCRKEVVHNVLQAPVAAPQVVTLEQVSQAIIGGCDRAGWRAREVAPGVVRAEKVFNQHRAMSEITYDTTSYSITLLTADNLLFDGRRVHKRYNQWADELEKSINDEMRFRFQ